MIRMVQSTSAAHAKAYFSEALAQADYYLDDQELQGRFQGKLVERLGLSPVASKDAFYALCENRHPMTGAILTPRSKENRTTGYDINFHAPKSLSILHALSKDNHILEVFEASVTETMKDIEADCRTRVRRGGRNEERATTEMIWAEFTHQTARPVDGSLPDPHLHTHCYTFNVTHDPVENRFKAIQFRDIQRDMPYYQARFHKRLSDRMVELGYQVRRTDHSFEIEGVPQKVIELFSKRTDEIGRTAKEKGITDAKALADLGARTRSKKQKGHSMTELRDEWRSQIKALPDGMDGGPVRYGTPANRSRSIAPERCVDHALKHSFERASVKGERRVLEAAYRYALGLPATSLDAITERFRGDDRIIRVQQGREKLCTTRAVLAEEKQMVDLARKGVNTLRPLYREAPKLALKDQQANAVRHVLTTSNRVSIIRGAAGAGKTTLMKEAVQHIEKAGKTVTVVAPTAEASRGVLRQEGFENAGTVAALLLDKKAQEALKDQVLWVDEAGLLGTTDMRNLLELAAKQNARLILGGDTRQHAAVVRRDALRILNTVAGIRSAEVNKIVRQKDADYRAAVEDLSKVKVRDGFDRLDRMGAIKAVDPTKPNEALIKDYIQAVKKGKTALVISPTHKQGEAVTEEIRAGMRQKGMIGKKEIKATRLASRGLTEAERGDWKSYRKGQVVQFNQNAPGFRRGSAWTIDDVHEGHVKLSNDRGDLSSLPLDRAAAFDLFDKGEIGLSKGDKVRITRNGFDAQDKRLNNGQTLDVVSVSKKGKIILRNAIGQTTYELGKDYGHIAHAHCITSHAAQGKTVDQVFISQPAGTFPATDAKQFYVSVSRARESVRIYTDDKEGLLERAAELGERQSAIELVAGKKTFHDRCIEHVEKSGTLQDAPVRVQDKDRIVTLQTIERDYEPRL